MKTEWWVKYLLTTALLLIGCGKPPCRVEVHGASDMAPAWLAAPDLEARTVAAAETAAEVWGGRATVLDGWTITFYADAVPCGNGVPAMGCASPYSRDIRISVWGFADCPEATTVAHEVGHAVIWDPAHADPRWHDAAFWNSMTDALSALNPACHDSIAAMAAWETTP